MIEQKLKKYRIKISPYKYFFNSDFEPEYDPTLLNISH